MRGMQWLPGFREVVREAGYLGKSIGKVLLISYAVLVTGLVIWHYPYDVDAPPGTQPSAANQPRAYYDAAYQPASAGDRRGLDYEAVARAAAERQDIAGKIRNFANEFGLRDKKVLEVGSGRGYLQDIVPDYTGLDISPSVANHYHKRFVAASATEMPFPDDSFDALWTIWVIEHIPQPEKVFREIRRVLKPGGVAYLDPAWNCTPWAAHGLNSRPYSDFNWRGKLTKASLVIQQSSLFGMLYLLPIRAIRYLDYETRKGATPLHFRALQPNYEIYWEEDADATTSLDSFETYLWFKAQGDNCRNCGSVFAEFRSVRSPMIIEIRK